MRTKAHACHSGEPSWQEEGSGQKGSVPFLCPLFKKTKQQKIENLPFFCFPSTRGQVRDHLKFLSLVPILREKFLSCVTFLASHICDNLQSSFFKSAYLYSICNHLDSTHPFILPDTQSQHCPRLTTDHQVRPPCDPVHLLRRSWLEMTMLSESREQLIVFSILVLSRFRPSLSHDPSLTV